MTKIDNFTQQRIRRAVQSFRTKTGQLPTLKNLKDEGFDDDTIKLALKAKIIEEFYVTLSNGSIVKGYKLSSES